MSRTYEWIVGIKLLAGQYRHVLNLDADGKVTCELFDRNDHSSHRLRASTDAFANSVDHEMASPFVVERSLFSQ